MSLSCVLSDKILNPEVKLSKVIGATPVINILSTTVSVPFFNIYSANNLIEDETSLLKPLIVASSLL